MSSLKLIITSCGSEAGYEEGGMDFNNRDGKMLQRSAFFPLANAAGERRCLCFTAECRGMAASGHAEGSYGWLLQPSFPLESEVLVNSHYRACDQLLDKASPVMGLKTHTKWPFQNNCEGISPPVVNNRMKRCNPQNLKHATLQITFLLRAI